MHQPSTHPSVIWRLINLDVGNMKEGEWSSRTWSMSTTAQHVHA